MTDDGKTREAILNVALRLFHDQGYDKTSLREIADEVGVTKAALYYHFAAKEELLLSLVRPAGEALDGLLDRMAQQELSPLQVFHAYFDLLADVRPVMFLMVRDPMVIGHPEIGFKIRQQQRRLRGLLSAGTDDANWGLRAQCAVGALHRGIFTMNLDDREDARHVVVGAALGALLSDDAPAALVPTG